MLAAVVVPLVLLPGCGSDPKAPDTTAPAGFTVFKDDKAGFAIAAPADWQEIELTDELADFNEKANELRLQNPKLSNAIVLARSVAQAGGKLFVVDREGATSLNLTVGKANEKSLDEVAATIKPALTELGATELTDEGINLPAGPAMRLRFKNPLVTDEGTVILDEAQYYLLKDGNLYILTVVSADPALGTTIAETLRIR